jgi:hypothetical protein
MRLIRSYLSRTTRNFVYWILSNISLFIIYLRKRNVVNCLNHFHTFFFFNLQNFQAKTTRLKITMIIYILSLIIPVSLMGSGWFFVFIKSFLFCVLQTALDGTWIGFLKGSGSDKLQQININLLLYLVFSLWKVGFFLNISNSIFEEV